MKEVNFYTSDGVELNGILYEEKNKPQNKSVILSVHGMTSNCFKKRNVIIANKVKEKKFDYFTFNTRGSDIVKYITKKKDGNIIKEFGGTAYEDVLEGKYDICGAIDKLIEMGYTSIYLLGHSLGCTKIVYTYNNLLDNNDERLKYIKGIILLSMVDIPSAIKIFLGEKYQDYIKLALDKQKQNKELEIMPNDSFINPISVKSFLRYALYNEEIDFININKDPNLVTLNKIKIPLFMRWGNINELIIEDAKIYSEKINKSITNKNKDINYIDGADHGYHGKEEQLANQIWVFLGTLLENS